jgi:hypothetical protein
MKNYTQTTRSDAKGDGGSVCHRPRAGTTAMEEFKEATMAKVFRCAALMLCICAIAFTFAGCAKKPVTPGAPAATALDKLSSSAFTVANTLDASEKEYEALYASNLPGVSDDGYARTVTQMFLSAQSCTGSYIGQLKSLATVDDSNRAQVAGWSTAVIACVNNLLNNGVTGIKNADARQKIQNMLAPIPAAIKLIADLTGVPIASATRPDFYFTEVKLGPKNRSGTYRTGYPVSRERCGIFAGPQTSCRSYRSTAPGRCSQAQRRGCGPDADIPFASRRTGISNPLREAWLHT